MLSYQAQIVEGLLRSDGALAVLGRGLGAQAVLLEAARRLLRDGGSDSRHATRLIFVLHTPQEEAEILVRRAREDPRWTGLCDRLVAVSSEMGVEDRAEAFARGGVFLASARLLVPDLLTGRLVAEAVDGALVNHAHSVGELSPEAFVLRLLRSGGRPGGRRCFVRALSDQPEAFAGGEGKLEKVMKLCFTHHLEVWPRIRAEVQDCLQGASNLEVCQKTLELPPRVKEIQRHLLNIIEGTLEELQRDRNVNLGPLNLKGSMFKSFEAEIRQALGPVWQSLGPRTRRTVQDLGSLRQLLSALPRCDAVEFHRLLESMWTADGGREAPVWLASPDAQALHALAKARVYEFVASGQAAAVAEPPSVRRTLEPHTKWRVLLDIVEQTIQAVAAAEAARGEGAKLHDPFATLRCGSPAAAAASCVVDDDSGSDIEIVSVVAPAKRPRLSADPGAAVGICEPRLLVVVPDDRTRRQVSSVLHHGADATLLDSLGAYLKERTVRPSSGRHKDQQQQQQQQQQHEQQQQQQQPPQQAAEYAAQHQRSVRGPEAAALAREAVAVARERDELVPQSVLQPRLLEGGRPCHPRIDIVASDGPEGTLDCQLRNARPHAVVLFEPSLEAIRALEVFCAEVGSSIAAQLVKRELDAEHLGDPEVVAAAQQAGVDLTFDLSSGGGGARDAPQDTPTRAHLLVFDESIEKYRFHEAVAQESRAVDSLIRARQHVTVRLDEPLPVGGLGEAAPRSSRRGGGSRNLQEMVQQKVVVDMREFRSALPFMLYMRGLTVDPVTIPVGDYVLSRDICVERKAIPDLVQSLASGRLYQQAQSMCQHYANPSLLIEFDPGKSFALQNTYTIARREVDVGARDLLGKLSLLVLHFPKLRMIWSPSQSFTADVFLKLKAGRYQPDPVAAAKVDSGAVDPAEGNPSEDAAADGEGRRRTTQTNTAALDVLRKLPGVTPRNLYSLARRAGSLAGVAALPLEALEAAMSKANAKLLFDFLHAEVATLPVEPKSSAVVGVGSAAAASASGSSMGSVSTATAAAGVGAEAPASGPLPGWGNIAVAAAVTVDLDL